MRRAKVDRTVLEIDDDPVEPRAGHDLHGLNAGNGRNRSECRTSFPPQLAETVERLRRRRGQIQSSVSVAMMALGSKASSAARWRKDQMDSRRDAAAEKRHQRPAQPGRPSGSENHLGAGMIRFAAGEAAPLP